MVQPRAMLISHLVGKHVNYVSVVTSDDCTCNLAFHVQTIDSHSTPLHDHPMKYVNVIFVHFHTGSACHVRKPVCNAQCT